MPDLPAPEPPPEQVALRALLNDVLPQYGNVALYRHDDTFWESDSGREAVYGWGTQVTPLRTGRSFQVWFDGLDNDIAVFSEESPCASGWRARRRGFWFEWLDLADMASVLSSVEDRVRELLQDYR
jgi:hypothetical protein